MPELPGQVLGGDGHPGSLRPARPLGGGRVAAGVADGQDAAVVSAGHQRAAGGGDPVHCDQQGRPGE